MPLATKTQTPAPAERQKSLDVFDLAARWNRHAVTVRIDHAAGRIPAAFRVGRGLRWRMTDIEAFENGTWRPAGLKKQAVTQ
jgi:hypothetical protein